MSESFKMVADGIRGSEGPVLDTRGRLFCVAPSTHQVLRIDGEGEKHEVANTGGKPAGCQVSADDAIWIADMDLGVLRLKPDTGELSDVVRQYDDAPIRGCNDCAFDSKGNLYITAPAGSSAEQRVGEVYCRLVDGTVKRLDGGYAFSNGLAVSADDTLLIVAETPTKTLWAYDIHAPGEVGAPRRFATLTGEHNGGPDGMDYDEDGQLLVTNHGGSVLEVFDSAGQRTELIELPFDHPSNVHFGGADGRDLYITEHTNHALWRTRWRRPGLVRFPVMT